MITARRKKLCINEQPCIDFYNDKGHWLACIFCMDKGWLSVRLSRVELLGCYHTEPEALKAVCFWLDITPNDIKE